MPLRNSDVDKFMQNKMSFERVDGDHAKYRFGQQTAPVMRGVKLPSIQHGRGDIPTHIIKQFEAFFGVSNRVLSEATDCHYSAMAIHLSFAIKHLDGYVSHFASDPVAFEPLLLGFSRSLPEFVTSIRGQHDEGRKHRNDRTFKNELANRLATIETKLASIRPKAPMVAALDAALSSIREAIGNLGQK